MNTRFTLAEVIFGSAIVLLLAAIAPLAAEQAAETAKLTACADNLRQIGSAEHAYAADNKSFIAIGVTAFIREGGCVRAATYNGDTSPMLLINKGYLKIENKPAATVAERRERFFRCPEDEVNFSKVVSGWKPPYPTISYQYCWFTTQQGLAKNSYPRKLKPEQDDNYGLRANIDRDDPGWYIFSDLMKATSRKWVMLPDDKAKSNHFEALNCLYLGGHVKSHVITEAHEKHVTQGVNRFTLFYEDVE
ncbi:MAG: hypothetical protein E7056_09415 [Lentisphaerae bacterium]|nr:hypothetical protein [Lentisphaerota bacterium]